MMMESGERWDAVVSQIGTKGTLYWESEERLVKSVLAEQARIWIKIYTKTLFTDIEGSYVTMIIFVQNKYKGNTSLWLFLHSSSTNLNSTKIGDIYQ